MKKKIRGVLSRRLIIKDLERKNTFLDIESYFIYKGTFDLGAYFHPKDSSGTCLLSGDYNLHLDPFRTIILKDE